MLIAILVMALGAVLLGAAVLAGVVGDVKDTLVILAVVLMRK